MELPSKYWRFTFLLIVVAVLHDCSADDELYPCHRSTLNCPKPDAFETGEGSVSIAFKINCNNQPYYGAYIQLVDYFQAVNDVIAHGHTDLDGNVELSGKFFYYSDSDLSPPTYEYKIIVYHYCNVNPDRKNQCHQVGTYTSDISCTQNNAEIKLNLNCIVINNQFKALFTNTIEIGSNQKLVCLDGQ